jgi:hypothetical protein
MIGTHRNHRLPRLVKPVGQAMPSHFHQLLTPRRADSAFRMGILKRPTSLVAGMGITLFVRLATPALTTLLGWRKSGTRIARILLA